MHVFFLVWCSHYFYVVLISANLLWWVFSSFFWDSFFYLVYSLCLWVWFLVLIRVDVGSVFAKVSDEGRIFLFLGTVSLSCADLPLAISLGRESVYFFRVWAVFLSWLENSSAVCLYFYSLSLGVDINFNLIDEIIVVNEFGRFDQRSSSRSYPDLMSKLGPTRSRKVSKS